jgi:CRP-like cAMP-binding protein
MTIDDDISFFVGCRRSVRTFAAPPCHHRDRRTSRYVHSGEVLFREGRDEADGGFVIQEGRFSLASSEDDWTITVGPFTLLGELALFTETQRPATATALEPSTVLLIPRELFIKMLDSFPDAARKLREILAQRLDTSAREIDNVRAVLDAHERE